MSEAMVEENVLTAEQGADRVAKRFKKLSARALHDIDEDDESTPYYTCENCGDHAFELVRTFNEQQAVLESLECFCDRTDVAATRRFLATRTYIWVGHLKADHRVYYGDDEIASKELDQEEFEQDEQDIVCESCYKKATPQQWESENLGEPEVDDASEYFEVRCTSCDHEIEFGWSHPDRGGRIWPCESADFNPWKTWPESRFVSAWQRRGWLRPN